MSNSSIHQRKTLDSIFDILVCVEETLQAHPEKSIESAFEFALDAMTRDDGSAVLNNIGDMFAMFAGGAYKRSWLMAAREAFQDGQRGALSDTEVELANYGTVAFQFN